MIRHALMSCAIAILPQTVLAQPQPAVAELMPYMEGVATCFYDAADRSAALACIGQGAGHCMDADPEQNQTTVGMMFCALAEKEAWDRVLNAQYQTTLEGLRRDDEQDAEYFPEFANRATALRDAQRAWIPLRDADCALEYALWGSGSMRQIAGADCVLRRTAERAVFLRFLGHEMRG